MCVRVRYMCVRGSDLPLVLRFFVRFPNCSDGVVVPFFIILLHIYTS